jgi:hypothetical protein
MIWSWNPFLTSFHRELGKKKSPKSKQKKSKNSINNLPNKLKEKSQNSQSEKITTELKIPKSLQAFI